MNWTIATDFPVLDGETCVCKCTIADESQRVVATGHAHEERSSSNINKTSYVENCETSAVGRALAMLGIGIDTSIASANEVEEAIAKQQAVIENPHVQKLSKALDAPVENIMDKAVGYIKSQTDKKKAFNAITSVLTNSPKSKWQGSRSSCDDSRYKATAQRGQRQALRRRACNSLQLLQAQAGSNKDASGPVQALGMA